MKKVFLVLLLLIFCAGTGKGLYFLKNGFSPRRICSFNFYEEKTLSNQVEEILSQPFHYLGRGRQCFAFSSEDGKYVLKLPRTDIYKLPFWAKVLPLSNLRKRMEADRTERREFILKSFQIASEQLKDQTGIIAHHLGYSAPQNKKISLVDNLGVKHTLPLEKISFILQYKQPMLIPQFLSALSDGNEENAKKILKALVNTITERGKKGILNRDRSFLRNYGYDGEKAYQIDIGSFYIRDCTDPYQKSVLDSIAPIDERLSEKSPQMVYYLNNIHPFLSLSN